MKKLFQRGLIASGALASSVPAFAVGPDMTALTAAVDFGTVTTAILAIAAIIAVVYVAVKGAKIGLSMIRGG